MAPIKFEEHIKEQLEKRQISPSEASWDKLEARLDAAENKDRRNSKWWIGVAAAVVAVLVIAGSVFTAEDVTNTPQIVEQPVEKTSSPSVKEELKPETHIASEEVEKELFVEEDSEKTSGFRKPQENMKTEVAQTETVNQLKEKGITDSTSVNPAIQNQPEEAVFRSKLEEIIAAVNSAEREKGNIKNAEVNSLLAEAAKEISREAGMANATEVVDANALLRAVEGELDESFRQKVFEMLKEGVIKARTAVVTRNN
ncbi:hypothetical protein [Autumnicola musiva]|uniref:Anti-sigma factor n=1 Tax=Autumnicola musiva TaxID=3075589 RepID=A0ABU3D2G0_9FLAO|nr:hypothetical protein [Zunongwangia sp. F117]MDT0675707.1 hypothetical protein [Zunongwangia sp. F117]